MPKVKRGRAETEQKLIEVALNLIRQRGVLSGLNLKEVAEAAGVNRGNIYHYFGSRQELLRSAITRQFADIVDSIKEAGPTTGFISRRVRNFLKHNQDNVSDSQLRALLVLDGDPNVDPIPMYEAHLSQLRKDVIDGAIDKRHDLDALQVALSAFGRGYRIFRFPYAKRVGVTPEELDQRVSRILASWLEAMAAPPSQAPDK
jgi:AcrR family transcriptional regulator